MSGVETMVGVAGRDTVWADDSSGDGPPLVLLHPGVGDSRIWEPLMPALTGTHRVIRYDARGYGRSPAPTAPTPASAAGTAAPAARNLLATATPRAVPSAERATIE